MTASPTFDRFLALWAEIRNLAAASEVLGWEQETYMPAKGGSGRAQVLSTLAGIAHDKQTSSELRDLLDGLSRDDALDGDQAAMVREAIRLTDRAARVPKELATELAKCSSQALETWRKAREANDFAAFVPALSRMVDLKRQEAAAIAPGGNPYDALLDEFEPGMTEAQLEPLFRDLRTDLSALVKGVAEAGSPVSLAPVQGELSLEKQLAFSRLVVEAMGFDFEAGRIDKTTHPFCSGFHPDDVRITWRGTEDDLRPALFGLMHEAGHGLYEQGLPRQWERTPIGEAVSLGVHESQSRLWENLVGRSTPFWNHFLPKLAETFPCRAGFGVEEFVAALHAVEPSFVRVEADEVTYNLHIAVRFEIERRLFRGDLNTAELPEAWNGMMEEMLGIVPPTAAEGVLQDIHWSMGAFGYFPTYTLGNLFASQLFEAAGRALPDLEGSIAAGDLAPLRVWLTENVHSQGSRYSAAALIERATGEPPSAEPFLRHVRRLVEETYGAAAG